MLPVKTHKKHAGGGIPFASSLLPFFVSIPSFFFPTLYQSSFTPPLIPSLLLYQCFLLFFSPSLAVLGFILPPFLPSPLVYNLLFLLSPQPFSDTVPQFPPSQYVPFSPPLLHNLSSSHLGSHGDSSRALIVRSSTEEPSPNFPLNC
uniref:Uncharacterized protein n=1 Tax=Sphaerodactylus townsendi TaxID=933632 RepID=A0ACB8G2G2_9SAUR